MHPRKYPLANRRGRRTNPQDSQQDYQPDNHRGNQQEGLQVSLGVAPRGSLLASRPLSPRVSLLGDPPDNLADSLSLDPPVNPLEDRLVNHHVNRSANLRASLQVNPLDSHLKVLPSSRQVVPQYVQWVQQIQLRVPQDSQQRSLHDSQPGIQLVSLLQSPQETPLRSRRGLLPRSQLTSLQ